MKNKKYLLVCIYFFICMYSFSYGQIVDSVKIYRITWCLIVDVPDPCPGYMESEFGQRSNVSCGVYHHHYEKKCENEKQFTKLKEAKECYQRALQEQEQKLFMRGGISDVKLDSIWIKIE